MEVMQNHNIVVSQFKKKILFTLLPASRTAGKRRPAETQPEQKAGPDGGSGPDAHPHH